jgi:hypothetical protein
MKYSPKLLYAAFIFASAVLFTGVAKAQANSPGKWGELRVLGSNGERPHIFRHPLSPAPAPAIRATRFSPL